MFDLDGKVVLVTGGSRGIGAACVRVLAAAGASVVLHYGHNRAAAEAVAAGLATDPCLLVEGDLETGSAAAAIWRDAVAWRGHVDVLVNNAGIFEAAGIDADPDTWRRAWQRTLAVNLVAPADLCREALGHFRQQGGGIIVNIASRAAFRGDTPDHMHYAASKGGLVALTRSIARGFAADNVLAYGVAPGFVRTDMAEDFVRAHGETAVTDDIPLGEMASPDDVANVVAFLASGKARHATGTTIDINGASYVR
jgi:NAD(P)-dependent dehydrogenase (short-subunit alcohol dehydrogenase family)